MKRRFLRGNGWLLAFWISLAGSSLSHAACVSPPEGLIAWWQAEGNGNDTVGSNSAVLINGVGYTNGLVGQAFQFGGVDGRIVVSNAPALNFPSNQDFSIEAWINPLPSVTDYGVMSIVDKRLESGAKGYELNLSDGKLHCRLTDSDSNFGQEFGPAGPDLRDGSFHHVALSLARNSTNGGNLYVDGQVVMTFDATGVAGDLSNTEPLHIGNHVTPFLHCFFKGQIDEVSLYNRALSTSEVQSIYQAGGAGKCAPHAPPSIIVQPQGRTVAPGGSVTFSVVATGTAPLSYQWRLDGGDISGATADSLTLTNVQSANAGAYSVLVTNAFGSALSQEANLSLGTSDCVSAPAGLIAWWQADNNGADSIGGNSASLTTGVGFTNGLVGQAFAFDGNGGRVVVPNSPVLNFGSNQDFSIEAWINPQPSTTDYGVMSIVDKRLQSGAKGYEFNLSDGRIHCRLSDSEYSDGQEFGPAGPDLRDGTFHHVALSLARNSTNGGNLYVDGQVVLTFAPTGQTGDLSNTEPFRIGNHATPWLNCFFNGEVDEISLYRRALTATEVQAIYAADSAGKCETGRPPSIISQPQGRTVLPGANVTFNVVAVGTGPISYQWRHDGSPIFGATTNSLLLTNVQTADAGNYSVEVTNAFGSALSQDAILALISTQCASLPQDIVGWWKAEGNGDDSAGTNNALLAGEVGFTNGLVGDAFRFDGGNARITVSNAPALNFGSNQDFSIETWINPLPANTDFGVMSVVDKRLQSGAKGYEFNLSDGKIHCRISDSAENDGQDFGPAGPDLRDGAFHHVALTLLRNSTNGGRLYVDGQSVLSFDATGVAGDLSNAEPLHIGNHATPELNCFFKGRIDEVSLYARALSAAEVQAIFGAGSAGKCAQTGTNHPPVASDVMLSTSQDEPLTIPAANLLAATSDLDNDPLTLSSVAQSSTNGSTLVLGTDAVVYVPPPGFVGEDHFTYTVSDNRNGSASASAIIQIRAMNRAALRMSPLIQLPTGFRVTFLGIPARTYSLQRAEKLTGPWQTLTSIIIGADGLGSYIDTNAPPSAAFYRMLP